MNHPPIVAVVIPAYRVKAHILSVVSSIEDNVDMIFVVDDACPEQSGDFLRQHNSDPRVRVVMHEQNQGVGGAVMTGYRAAMAAGAEIMVKIDGDGQMDPSICDAFVLPIAYGLADYTKGNRFYSLENIHRMPLIRILGNAALSFMTKLSTGYWDLFDPTNGYTAIHRDAVSLLPFDKISKRYFFETDMLFRLGIVKAKVVDVPMDAFYGEEVSNLKISKILGEFLGKHTRNFFKRIFYNYFLRGMSIASLELIFGVVVFLFGVVFGAYHWASSASRDVATPTGTVMLSALCILSGLQLLLAFLSFDFASAPREPLHLICRPRRLVRNRDSGLSPDPGLPAHDAFNPAFHIKSAPTNPSTGNQS
jgi:dolichol-phosphate mannosyltransferase